MNKRSNTSLGIGISVALIALAMLFLGHWSYRGWGGNGLWWPMHHGYYGPGMMHGFGGFGIVPLLFWGVVILVVIFLVVGGITRSRENKSTVNGASDALSILEQRYARGEIDKEQFIDQREVLKK